MMVTSTEPEVSDAVKIIMKAPELILLGKLSAIASSSDLPNFFDNTCKVLVSI